MKLSKETIAILNNFLKINNSIVIKQTPTNRDTTVIKTINREKRFYAEAEVMETFDHTVAIYDLQKLTSIISLYEEPTVELNESYLTVKNKYANTRLMYASLDAIIFPEKDYPGDQIPTLAEFNITKENVDHMDKMCKIMQYDHLAFRVEDGNIVMVSTDPLRPNPDEHKSIICPFEGSFTDAIFRREYFTLIPDDYSVKIKETGVEFRSMTNPNNFYFVSRDSN